MNKTKDGELLTLDAIRSGIRFQRSVAEGWIKVSKELVCTPDLLLEMRVLQNLKKLRWEALNVRDGTGRELE